MDADFAFDAKDALVTADIDLIMDDEPCDDAVASGAVTMWQDDAARILFADATEAATAATTPVKQPSSAADDWRQPCLRTESRSRASTSRSYRKHASSISAATICRAAYPPSPSSSAVRFEPSHEPCTDEIPYSDLVFWLGDAATGEVECSCAMCVYARAYSYHSAIAAAAGSRRYSPYGRISSKIPVINLPRIEGVN